MGAPAGNQFWKMRSKHGRDRIFTEPNILLDAAYEYFKYQSDRAWLKKEAVKGGEFTGQIIDVPIASPFSLEGLCLFLGVHTKYLIEFEKGLKPNDVEIDKDFSNIVTHIREVIYLQKSEGAIVGAYNASIIAKQLGLTEKISNEISGPGGKAIETNGSLTVTVVNTALGISASEKDIQQAVEDELS